MTLTVQDKAILTVLCLLIGGIAYWIGVAREDDARVKLAYAFRDQGIERLLFGDGK